LVGDDKTGQVGKGSISLHARTFEAKWRHSVESNAESYDLISVDIESDNFNGTAGFDEKDAWYKAKHSKTNGLVYVPILFSVG
jgi:hypothetical protein